VALTFLGIFLMSSWGPRTNWTFDNVLTQIGLGYPLLFLLAFTRVRVQVLTVALILVGYWAVFALYPLPPEHFGYTLVNVDAAWLKEHGLTGFAAHWQKNSNLGWAFDYWFMNLFPRPHQFWGAVGGYATLSFIPSLATMTLGLLAGELVRDPRFSQFKKFAILLVAGLVGLGLGWAIDRAGICPIVKRIWTPSWTIFSAGWTFVLLAVFYLVIDVARLRFWTLPLVVVGMNSIAVYCMSMLLKPWVRDNLKRHVSNDIYNVFGQPYARMTEAAIFLLFCWGVCWWMYRKKVFIRI
jgi:predicted acyltransferase